MNNEPETYAQLKAALCLEVDEATYAKLKKMAARMELSVPELVARVLNDLDPAD